MSGEPLDELLLRWEELYEQGQEVSAEELCRSCPDHAEELSRRMHALKAMTWVKETVELTDQAAQSSGEGNASGGAGAQPSRMLAGRYRLDQRLGEGGFGEVWKAYDLELQRAVAVKLPKPSRLSSRQRETSFLAEARKAARLKHPGIVPIHDVRQEGGVYFIVAELVDGTDLAEKTSQGSLSATESARLVSAIAEALHHAHGQGLIHRDIKPGNILVDSNGKPHITDFGSALKEEEAGTEVMLTGTPHYMSPEQVHGEGHRVDSRSDVFSLGVVFYELLTGALPFAGSNMFDVLQAIRTLEPCPPRQLKHAIPKELDRICLKALAKRASDRYATAQEMANDLQHFQDHTPEQTISVRRATVSRAEAETGSEGYLRDSSTTFVTIVPKGLRSFDAHDADFFLGLLPGPRDRDGLPETIRFWKARLEETDPARTFTVGLLYGPSGCGKSSLVKAGLLPRLADAVVAIYVEATAEDTEARLLKGLRRHCPDLPVDFGLTDTLAGLRRATFLPADKKVLLVIDQFEQWLHANRSEASAELVKALRQCDGERVQCIIMVRDDFWMAATRFMQALEVRLVEAQNSAAVDLFDLRHAKKVLTAFGRGFGALPEKDTELTKEQEFFLEQAVEELAQEGKVISVRLALFAEMVKLKPWTPTTLRHVGGIAGIGMTFLEETFAGSTALPQHRLHQKAAQGFLRALLPETGADIKGNLRSRQELLQASGYCNRVREFEGLLHILDTELRLITPTDPEGMSNEQSGIQTTAGEKYYQLTHDYLVPSLRAWLTRKQKETWQGRAELLLADRAAAWNARPENRQLPALMQWLETRWLTQTKDWTPPQRKMMRKATRYHAGRVFGMVVLLALIGWGIYEGHGTLKAHALRDRLLDADTNEVPTIVQDMAPYHRWLVPLLQDARTQAAKDNDRRKQLHASVALLPVDASQTTYLYGRLLDAEPGEVSLIQNSLAPHKEELLERLWDVAQTPEKGKESQRLRAAAALAKYDPDSPRWAKVQEAVASDMVGVPAVYSSTWMDALRPVGTKLLQPLSALFRDRKRREMERSLATIFLVEYAVDRPEGLADLLMDGDEKQFAMLYPKIVAWGERGLQPLQRELSTKLPDDAKEEAKERLAKRQAAAGVALLRMGKGPSVWPFLKHRPDPRVRSYLIHRLAPMGADPHTIINQLDREEVSIRRALLLSLGEFGLDQLTLAEREAIVPHLLDLYRRDPDPGIHGAVEWLLRGWNQGEKIKEIDRQWLMQNDKRFKDIQNALAKQMLAKEPQWYVNGQGQTMVVVPGPVTFLMGSPAGEYGRREEEVQHARRIGQSFAIATKPVTVEQFQRFFRTVHGKEHEIVILEYAPTGDCPAHVITWYLAAEYCNWLSKVEGVPEEEWCYEPTGEGKYVQGMKLTPNYLSRTGYRLPTEAEWEYACRAGAVTSRFYGESDELLSKYGWCVFTSGDRTWPVGSLKPNDLGLFDMHGHMWTWCQERYQEDPTGNNREAAEDKEDILKVNDEDRRSLRGAPFDLLPKHVRSANRIGHLPTSLNFAFGLRPARTFR
jgi:serine/threonine protein kinase/formylglycine-generating enzyme required for sulfatase activity